MKYIHEIVNIYKRDGRKGTPVRLTMLLFFTLAGFFATNSITFVAIFLILGFFSSILDFFFIGPRELKRVFFRNSFFIPILILLLWLIVEVFISDSKQAALLYAKGWWTLSFIFFIPLLITNSKSREVLYNGLIGGVFLGIIWAFFSYFYTLGDYNVPRVKGIGTNSISFGVHLSIGILIMLYYIIYYQKKKFLLLFVPIAGGLFSIGIARSAGAFLSLIPSIILFILLIYGWKRGLPIVFLSILFYIIVYFSIPGIQKKINGICESVIERRGKIISVSERLYMWRAGIYIWKKHKIFGIGTGNMTRGVKEYLKNRELSYGERKYLSKCKIQFHTHNMYIDILARGGIVGFFIWMFLVFTFFRNAFRLRCSPIREENILGALSISAVFFIMVFSITENPFHRGDMIFPLVYIISGALGKKLINRKFWGLTLKVN